ncbi:hypothetical protein BOV_1340 [Brucella ovis ATCC 25840]|nr:hypothetical protein BOV_1340 [Brucella ovis ATCC 25840]
MGEALKQFSEIRIPRRNIPALCIRAECFLQSA